MPSTIRPRILLIDDEPDVLEGLALTLRRRFEVVGAPGGAEGLAALADQGPFAVVVSDMRMPGMNGAEVLARARFAAPDTTRLLLTGQADLESVIEAVNGGFIFRFLTKPCSPEALTRALDEAVEQHRLVTGDRELLERRVDALAAQLLQAERLATLGTLASAVGHEVNNVTTVLLGALHAVRARAAEGAPPDLRTVRDLERVAEHMRVHGRNLLTLGRPTAETATSVDLREVIMSTISMLQSAGRTRGVHVDVELPSPPLRVGLAPTRAEQVFMNLCVNALDALAEAPDRRGRLRVHAWSDGGGRVRCTVADEGCGIHPDELARIFEPYVSTKPPGKGTGLGLTVVRQIMSDAGGGVQVESQPGVGTTFTLDMPAA